MSGCLLIDGNNIVFRAYYAFDRQNLKTRDGKPTGALFGFVKMLLKLLKEKKPDYIAVAFDVSKDTFRRRIYPEYKAQRRPTPPDLLEQLPLARQVVEALGIKMLAEAEYEADDLIGTAAERFKNQTPILVITGDHDLLQLIDDRITVELCVKGLSETRLLDNAAFMSEYGFSPPGIIEMKAMMGDSSDNIPGVDGIGEKKAIALVREFKTIETLYDSIDKIGNPRLKGQVEKGKESAFLSKTLATIKCDISGDWDISAFAWNEGNLARQEFMNFLKQWEFASLLPSTIPASGGSYSTGTAANPQDNAKLSFVQPEIEPVSLKPLPGEKLLITRIEDLKNFLATAKDEICLDIETDGFNPFTNKIVGISLAQDQEKAVYVPLRHAYLGLEPSDQPPIKEVFPLINEALQNRTLVGHNLKFDLSFLEREGVKHTGKIFDTMLAAYIIDPTTTNALKPLAKATLGFEVIEYGQISQNKPFTQVSLAEATSYACQDVLLTMLLMEKYKIELANHENLRKLYEDLEIPLLSILLEMETTGIGLNSPYLSGLSDDLSNRMKELEAAIHGHAGYVFNVNSPKQLQDVLFTKLNLQPPKKTKTGFSTDSDVLKTLAPEHPICKELLDYRELAKLKTTYADSLEKLVEAKTGLIHTSFNQMVTATGRLSSSNPNMQNIPIKSEWGRKVRRAFIPPRTGDLFLSIDYSQIELRLLAHFSEDEALIDAFKRNLDIHALTARKLFSKSTDTVTTEERKIGKTVNFGIIYGISAHSLSEDLAIPRFLAKQYIDNFFNSFPQVMKFFDNAIAQARTAGKVQTLFRRERRLDELTSKSFQTRAFGERVARNTPLQGSAADLVKQSMLDTHKLLTENCFKTKLILQIHDELVFSCPPEEIKLVGPLLKKAMETTVTLKVPLLCDVSAGPNLADLDEVMFD